MSLITSQYNNQLTPSRFTDGVFVSLSHAFENKKRNGRWSKSRAAAFNSFYGFHQTIPQLANHILGEGKAFAPAYLGQRRNRKLISRIKDNFKGSQMVVLDFDNHTSLSDLQSENLVREYSFLQYETPSSTVDHKRTRCIFQLPRAIWNVNQYEEITSAFACWLSDLNPDPNALDATRFYFGSKDAPYQLYEDKIVSKDMLDSVLTQYRLYVDKQERKRRRESRYEENHVSIKRSYYIGALEDYLKKGQSTPEGQRNKRLSESAYTLALGGATVQEVEEQLISIARASGLTEKEVRATIKSSHKGAMRDLLKSDNFDIRKRVDDSVNYPKLWSRLLTSVLNHKWQNKNELMIALALAEHATRNDNVFMDDENSPCIDISYNLVERIIGMERHTVSKHFDNMLRSNIFIKTTLHSNYQGQVLKINAALLSDELHPLIMSSSSETYALLHKMYEHNRSTVFVYTAFTHKNVTRATIVNTTRLSKKTVIRALLYLKDAGLITVSLDDKTYIYELFIKQSDDTV